MVDGAELFDGLLGLTTGVAPVDAAARATRGQQLLWSTPRPAVGQTPHVVIHAQNKLKVRHYEPSGRVRRTPIVIVPSMINKAWICDLEPDRSLVRGLAERGHPVYLVDWGTPGPEDAEQGMAEAVLDLLRRAVDRSCRHAKAEKALVLGYCQGGVLAVMLAALRPERVAGLVALTTPVRFKRGGRFAAFCDASVCDPEALVDADGLVSTEVMGPAFKLLDPMGNWDKLLAMEAASHREEDLARAMARERWLEENVPLPGKLAVELIRYGYQQDRLLDGTWELRGEVVDVAKIRVPVLVTPCSRDFIAPAPACVPLAEAVSSADVELLVQDTGHIGVVVGSYGPKHYYGLIDRWARRVAPEGEA
jgi:polyhydroxyalkanoate synthase